MMNNDLARAIKGLGEAASGGFEGLANAQAESIRQRAIRAKKLTDLELEALGPVARALEELSPPDASIEERVQLIERQLKALSALVNHRVIEQIVLGQGYDADLARFEEFQRGEGTKSHD